MVMTDKEILLVQRRMEVMDDMDVYRYVTKYFPDMLPNGKKKILIRRVANYLREELINYEAEHGPLVKDENEKRIPTEEEFPSKHCDPDEFLF
ncbi:hypothetical protein J5839_03435 [Methanosarcinaceae archaeon]|nr:hypothetical protein [Methanosarcinaceae archaeon]MBQ3620552.1 hypothetical protein [Methanosarcinaceae archaeon]